MNRRIIVYSQQGCVTRLPRRVGLGVEVEDDRLPLEVAQMDGVAVLIGEFEVGGGISGRQHAGRLSLVLREVGGFRPWRKRPWRRCGFAGSSSIGAYGLCHPA